MKKTIIILRHAKAETGSPGQDDHDRNLAGRGVEDAMTMGEYMAKNDISVDKVLCSTARRCRETWTQLQGSYGKKPPVEYVQKLYLPSAGEILSLLAETPETVNSLMIIGHNPSFHELSLKLAKSGDKKLLDTLEIKFPTCALASFSFNGSWHDIATAKTTLVDLATPQLLVDAEH